MTVENYAYGAIRFSNPCVEPERGAQASEIVFKITYKKTYKGIFAPGIDTGRLVAVSSSCRSDSR